MAAVRQLQAVPVVVDVSKAPRVACSTSSQIAVLMTRESARRSGRGATPANQLSPRRAIPPPAERPRHRRGGRVPDGPGRPAKRIEACR